MVLIKYYYKMSDVDKDDSFKHSKCALLWMIHERYKLLLIN